MLEARSNEADSFSVSRKVVNLYQMQVISIFFKRRLVSFSITRERKARETYFLSEIRDQDPLIGMKLDRSTN